MASRRLAMDKFDIKDTWQGLSTGFSEIAL